MKTLSFPYEVKASTIFRFLRRPVAQISFWSSKRKKWLIYTMIVDTGADYTVFPLKAASDLGIDLKRECTLYSTRGIGGSERVYLYNKNALIKLGSRERKIPIGFLNREDIPPLLGRQKCLDTFDVLFSKFKTRFSESK